MVLFLDSLAFMANTFLLKPQCDQFEILPTKIRLPFSDLASTLNVESVRPKSTRNMKYLSPIFLRKEKKKPFTRCGRNNLRVAYLNCFGS